MTRLSHALVFITLKQVRQFNNESKVNKQYQLAERSSVVGLNPLGVCTVCIIHKH